MNAYIFHRSVYSSLFWQKGPTSDFKSTTCLFFAVFIFMYYFLLGELLLYSVVLISALQEYVCIYIYIYIHTHSFLSLLPTSTSHPSRSSQSTDLISLCSIAFHFVVVQLLFCAWIFSTPWTIACQVLLFSTISKFADIRAHWVSDAI